MLPPLHSLSSSYTCCRCKIAVSDHSVHCRLRVQAIWQVPGDMLERHSKICCLLDEADDQVISVDARLTQ